jgi:endonuclease-3 related protein
MQLKEHLLHIYQCLWEALGPQGWWPGDSPFEVAVGAILAQNTNWNNVACAIAHLKAANQLTPAALWELPEPELAEFLHPTGYYNLKARRLKNFLEFLFSNYQGSLAVMATEDLVALRPALLSVKGIGPETADSILLYALEKPTFVVDAYTFRILSRHALVAESCSYDELQQIFFDHLPVEVGLYKEYHALLVRLGKSYCRPQRPLCEQCPLPSPP